MLECTKVPDGTDVLVITLVTPKAALIMFTTVCTSGSLQLQDNQTRINCCQPVGMTRKIDYLADPQQKFLIQLSTAAAVAVEVGLLRSDSWCRRALGQNQNSSWFDNHSSRPVYVLSYV